MPCSMAAPEYVPVPVNEKARLPWESPDHVPSAWMLDRPAEVGQGRQPTGPRLGYPGPDIGYALTLAALIRDEVVTAPGEHVDDAVAGGTAIAMVADLLRFTAALRRRGYPSLDVVGVDVFADEFHATAPGTVLSHGLRRLLPP